MSDFPSFYLSSGELVCLRQLLVSDCKACVELIPQAASDKWSLANIESAILRDKGYFCVGIEYQNALLGFAIFSEVLDEMELLYIAVSERFLRKGLAEGLLRSVLFSKQGQMNKVQLEVRESNNSAIALYQKLGFQQVGRRKNYYSSTLASGSLKESALLFSLDFDASDFTS